MSTQKNTNTQKNTTAQNGATSAPQTGSSGGTATATAPNTSGNTAPKTTPNAAPSTAPSTSPKTSANSDDRGLRLAALRDLKDVKLSQVPDVRGWKVETSDHTVIGMVSRILLDQQQDNAVRYLEINVDAKFFTGSKPVSHDLLVPIGAARLAKGQDMIMLPSLTQQSLRSLPMLSPGAIGWEFERELAKAFGATQDVSSPEKLYSLDLFSVKSFGMLRSS